jgi:hypothetical protein
VGRVRPAQREYKQAQSGATSLPPRKKLVALKDKYDPANVFRFNHNIAPSNGAGKR